MAKVPSGSDEIFALNTQGHSYTLIWKANILSESEGTFAIRRYFCHQKAFCFCSSDKCTGMEITMFLPSDSNLKPFYSACIYISLYPCEKYYLFDVQILMQSFKL